MPRVSSGVVLCLAALLLCVAPSTISVASDTAITSEVDKLAKDWWGQRLAHCGESWYTWEPGWLTEYMQASLETRSYPVAEIQKLNGVEYSGDSVLHAKASRRILLPVDNPRWGMWEGGTSGALPLQITKVNGRWSISGGQMRIFPVPSGILCAWPGRIGQGRLPTKTIASYHLSGCDKTGGQGLTGAIEVNLTDVDFTVPARWGGPPNTVPFWKYPNGSGVELTEVRANGPNDPWIAGDCNFLGVGYAGVTLIDQSLMDKSRATLEQVRRDILAAQAEWRSKYPH